MIGGYRTPNALAIRTVLLQDGTAYVQAGAGLVADSVPQTEYDETRHKARAAMLAVEMAEHSARMNHIVGIGGKKS